MFLLASAGVYLGKSTCASIHSVTYTTLVAAVGSYESYVLYYIGGSGVS